jgi:hypothetical protein
MWFLFVNNVTKTPSPQTTLRFRDVQSIIPAIHAVDFNGEMTLRTTWVDDSPKWNLTLPRDGFDGGQSGYPDRDGWDFHSVLGCLPGQDIGGNALCDHSRPNGDRGTVHLRRHSSRGDRDTASGSLLQYG